MDLFASDRTGVLVNYVDLGTVALVCVPVPRCCTYGTAPVDLASMVMVQHDGLKADTVAFVSSPSATVGAGAQFDIWSRTIKILGVEPVHLVFPVGSRGFGRSFGLKTLDKVEWRRRSFIFGLVCRGQELVGLVFMALVDLAWEDKHCYCSLGIFLNFVLGENEGVTERVVWLIDRCGCFPSGIFVWDAFRVMPVPRRHLCGNKPRTCLVVNGVLLRGRHRDVKAL